MPMSLTVQSYSFKLFFNRKSNRKINEGARYPIFVLIKEASRKVQLPQNIIKNIKENLYY